MSLFQCEHCGCCENTALTDGYHCRRMPELFDWSGIEDRKGQALCSACSPATHSDGTPCDRGGKWHGEFDRVFLPKGEFRTNRQGNLEHIRTGSENFRQYATRVEAA